MSCGVTDVCAREIALLLAIAVIVAIVVVVVVVVKVFYRIGGAQVIVLKEGYVLRILSNYVRNYVYLLLYVSRPKLYETCTV